MPHSRRPSGLPHRIPLWAWLRLKVPGRFSYGPKKLPAWFWRWRAWRLHLKPTPKPKPKPVRLHMFDDVNPLLIPKNAQAVAGYIGGNWPTYPQIVKGWPKAKHVSIAVASRYDADCLDVEPGDATIAVAAHWVKRQLATWDSGHHDVRLPVVYTAASWGQALIDALTKAGLRYGVDYLWWSAHYNAALGEHLCGPHCGFGIKKTAHATQYTNKALGRSLDESICSPGFWS